ncbi:MAG: DUF882 domain-containing protein [Alphaproteobacteria bacterium]|nr:DUF882 domain-containing protein [Alphaproteobacteria bacterium]
MATLFDGTRRRFLQLGLMATACSVASPAWAVVPRLKGSSKNDRALSFHNLHTDERLRVAYWREGTYNRPGLAQINHILRDFRSGDVSAMSPRLMDLLYDLQRKLGNDNALEIISGYRSPRTNAMLASASSGVARQSYHTKGMAIDIRLSGTPLSTLHNTALAMRRGGVGYYPSSDFVHVDVGPLRKW